MKKSKKFLAVLSTTAMMASVTAAASIPFAANVAQAAAASTLSALFVPTISNSGTTAQLGTIDIFVPKGSITPNSTNEVTFTLPNGFQFDTTAGSAYAFGGSNNNVTWTAGTGSDVNVTSQQLTSTSVKLTVTGGVYGQTDDAHIYVKLGAVKLTGPSNGPVNVTFSAPSTSVLPSGTVVVANVQTSGIVDLAATDTQSSSDEFKFNLRLTEEVAGSLRNGGTVKLKLPNGFKWHSYSSNSSNTTNVFGNTYDQIGLNATANEGDDTLTITTTGNSNTASSFILQNLPFYVDDETSAKAGDVVVQVQGSDSTNVSTLVVGSYGEYGGTVTATSKPTVVAGKYQQKIGDIVIKEATAGSFISGRTITLQLPDGARWEAPFENSSVTKDDYNGSISTTNGLDVDVSYTDSDKRTLKLTFNGNGSQGSTTPGEVDLKNFEIAVEPGYSGDITLQVGGSEGLTGNVTVATAQKPVSISASTKPNVIIGSAGQQLGDITLTEAVAGAFGKETYNGTTYNKVHLELPYGVQFDGTPDVEVTSGDLKIKDVSSGLGSDNKGYLDFYVDSTSTTPSTITIKAPKLKLDRTVPQGDIVLKVKGDAVSFTAYAKDQATGHTSDYAVKTWNDNNTTSASAVIATVATPAPGDTTGKATFTIGSTSYTVNGQTMTADVAPYIKNDRTYLPVTYVAQALGVSLQNIIWNNAERSVTIFKGDRVVKMVIGSNVLVVNGVQYTMDVAPEITNDRTMLPIAHLATALGVPYTWDATTQSVTFGN
jgi:hypothetical protein